MGPREPPEPSQDLVSGGETTFVEGLGEGDADAPVAGRTIGRYVVLSTLGAGAMGVVVSAYDRDLDRRVAIKLMRRTGADGREAGAQRLLREAQALARLSHPNVVPVFDAGRADDGRVYLAMELVAGGTLREWVAASARPWQAIVDVLIGVAEGLAAAHRARIVHRDFKPDNVIVDARGRGKVLDFGLSRGAAEQDAPPSTALDSSDSLSDRLTRTGAVMGTPGYMAPEQHFGGAVDARADQYAFFVTLFEMLYGARPFEGRTVEAIAHAKWRGELHERPWRGPGAAPPPRVLALVRRGLARAPDERFASLDEVAELLRALRARSRPRWPLALAAAALIGTGAFVLQPRADRCIDEIDPLDAVWDGPRRSALVETFAAARTRASEGVTAAVTQALDEYAEAWRELHARTCRAGELDSTRVDVITSCLRRNRAGLLAAVDALSVGGRDVVHRSLDVVETLEPITACESPDPASVSSVRSWTPAQREQLEAALGQIEGARVYADAGQYEHARMLATEALAQAQRTGDARAIANAYLVLGLVDTRRGRLDAGDAYYRDAFVTATAAGDDLLAMQAGFRLTFLHAGERSDLASASEWLRASEAVMQRLPELPPLELARWHEVAAQVRELEGADGEAVLHLQQALAVRMANEPPDSRAILHLRNNLGSDLVRLGRLSEGIEMHELTLAKRRERLGEGHPDVAMSLLNLAHAHLYAGQTRMALSDLAAAEPIIVGALGHAHPWMVNLRITRASARASLGYFDLAHLDVQFAVAMNGLRFGARDASVGIALNVMGGIYFDAGLDEAAREAFGRAIELGDAAGSRGEVGGAYARANLANIEIRAHHLEVAQALLERARATLIERFGAEHADLTLVTIQLATVRNELGQPREAMSLLDEAARRQAGQAGGGEPRPQLAFERGRALWQLGELAAAREQVEHARAVVADSVELPVPVLTHYETWLREHPLPGS